MAFLAFETEIEIGRGATPTWTNLAEIQDVNLPTETADQIEVTSMSTPGRSKEFIAGRIDAGEVAISMFWEPESTTDALLSSIHASGEVVQIRFTIPSEATGEDADFVETWTGIMVGYERVAPVSEAATATATFKINGRVVSGG